MTDLKVAGFTGNSACKVATQVATTYLADVAATPLATMEVRTMPNRSARSAADYWTASLKMPSLSKPLRRVLVLRTTVKPVPNLNEYPQSTLITFKLTSSSK